jgi:hypothetical protein
MENKVIDWDHKKDENFISNIEKEKYLMIKSFSIPIPKNVKGFKEKLLKNTISEEGMLRLQKKIFESFNNNFNLNEK